MITTQLLISMPEIAELAGVQRPVVTVWRRRYSGSFPAPAQGSAKRPLFDARAVLDWLVETGRADREVLEPDLRQFALWHLGSRLKPEDLIRFATALVCLRALDDDEPLHSGETLAQDLARRAHRIDPADMLLKSEINALPDDADWLVAAVDELVEAAWGCQAAFERLLAMKHRLNVPVLYRDSISPELAKLIALISGMTERIANYDTVKVLCPWAGSGDLLAALIAAAGEHGQPTISATAGTEDMARLLRRRLAVSGLPLADIDVRTQNQLTTDLAWHVLVAAMPYQSQESRSRERQLRFLARQAANLRTDQTAVVLGPADLTADQIPITEVGIRNEILRTDVAEAIVTLPGGLMPYRPGYQPGLWVLRRDESGRGHGRVLCADISDRPLTTQVVDDLVEDITTWRRDGYHPAAHRQAITSPRSIAALLSGQSLLAGQRAPEPSEADRLRHARVAQLLDLQTQLAAHSTQRQTMPLTVNVAARDEPTRPTVTIETLINKKLVRRLKGARIADEFIARDGHHRIVGTPELNGQPPSSSRMIDRLILAERYPRVRLTEPGDVIITTVAGTAAYVDLEGFNVVEYPAAVLRISSRVETLTPRTLAALINATASGRAPSAVRARRLDQITLPLLEEDETAALDRLLAQVEQQRRRAQEQLDILNTLSHTALAGIADGTLTITRQQSQYQR